MEASATSALRVKMDIRHKIYYPLEEFEALARTTELATPPLTKPPAWMANVEPPGDFGGDDAFIEQYAYVRHPLLRAEPLEGRPFLFEQQDVILGPDERVLVEYAPDGTAAPSAPPPGIYCVVSGRFKLVSTRGEQRRAFSQCRPGQLLGLPRLLRAYYAQKGIELPWPRETKVEAIAVGGRAPHIVRFMPIDEALRLMHEREDFRRFVVNHVAVRFVHRRRIFETCGEGCVLRLLNPADREYLLQLGRLVRAENRGDAHSVPYLEAGKPSNRAALLVSGEASLYRPRAAKNEPPEARFLGKITSGHLIGHEGFVQAEDTAGAEPPRPSEIRLTAGAEVLEFYWYALRAAVADRKPIWDRMVRVFAGEAATTTAPLPGLVTFQAAGPGLDLAELAYGAAAALARNAGAHVYVVDLQGQESYERWWKQQGHEVRSFDENLMSASRRKQAPRPEAAQLEYAGLTPPLAVPFDQRVGTVPEVRVVWPKVEAGKRADPEKVERLIEKIRSEEGVRWIVLSDDGSGADERGHSARDLAEIVNQLSAAVFYVSDDAEAGYHLSTEEPATATFVYRMNKEYVARERRRIRALADPEIGSTRPLRRIVRVPEWPDDPFAMGRGLASAFAPETLERSATARAFQRLARVVEGRTVGLALSGGGAWGFAHVPLIAAIEKAGIPIDYVTGTSFGSIVGAIFAAGGSRGLAEFIADNCVKPGTWEGLGLFGAARAVIDSELACVTLVETPLHSPAMQHFIDRACRRYGRGEPLLTTTEIPFYPVGTDLDAQVELFNVHKSLGWGVRMSGAMPPLYMSVEVERKGFGAGPPPPAGDHHYEYRVTKPRARGLHHIVDGAFLANVPSRVAREVGAGFVIASNVIPPVSAEELPQSGFQGLLRRFGPQAFVRRADDMNRGMYLQTWKGGEDQGRLYADYRVSLQPQGFEFFEMWRGADICEQMGDTIEAHGIKEIVAAFRRLDPSHRSPAPR